MSSDHLTSETLASGTVIAGRYRVERRLGQGGMGSVFLVQHVHTDERFALKLLHSTVVKDQATLDRFRREARTPARIDSDHVVRVTDADVAPELDDVPFLVMEYLRGEDLQQLSERRGALPPNEVVLLLSQAARGLDKAHAIGIVHRDLKPENLFLTQREDGTPSVKILDFGIAKMTGGDVQEAGRITSTGQIFGTPLYMSPEQAMAESEKLGPRTDVWALGLIAHRLLHGKEFWTAQTITHLIAQIAFEPIPPPSARGCTLGPGYDHWFGKCCAREISQRYGSAGEAVAALARALDVNDSPSQLRALPLSVRVSTSSQLTDERDALAATATNVPDSRPSADVAEGVTSVNGARPSGLGRTQFGAETAKPARVTKATIGYVAGAVLAVLAGGIAAWQITEPPPATNAGGSHVPAFTARATAEPPHPAPGSSTAPPQAADAPLVTPSGEVVATAAPLVTADPAPKTSASSTVSKPPTSPTGAAVKATAAPAATPSAVPTAAPTAAPTTKPSDPLSTRR